MRHYPGLATDSRSVRPGYLFLAVPGTKRDGRDYIEDALRRGASCVVVPMADASRYRRDLPGEIEVLGVPDVREASGLLASEFHGHPSRDLRLVGITGTNGKTTTSFLLEAVFEEAGLPAGVIGTINQRFRDRVVPSDLTTPDPIKLQASLASMREWGAGAVVMEVSSHSLDQKRVAGCAFSAALFTNLTRDHLDYHATMEDYYAAKARLFLDHNPDVSVINLDCPYGKRLWEATRGKKTSYGTSPEAMVRPLTWETDLGGIRAHISTPAGTVEVKSGLVGAFNLMNILAATATAVAMGLDTKAISRGISRLVRVHGRLDPVPSPRGISAFVDYAHTPDALEQVLRTLRALGPERIITVTGCGGDRDPGKRPVMAKKAWELSDVVIFTSDNPRTEDPDAILDQMLDGIDKTAGHRTTVKVIPDRRTAIGHAASICREGDCILIAGKGHETYQIVGTKRLPFDDRAVTEQALAERVAPVETVQSPSPFPAMIAEIARAMGARILCGDKLGSPTGISTDTRAIAPGELFVALSGGRFDGHGFAAEAARKGASGVVIHKDASTTVEALRAVNPKAAVLLVPDTLRSLGDLAAWYRTRLGVRVIGITGSCGKTGTKELVASVLAGRFRVLWTAGNFNNLIGLPLTLLGARPPLDLAVLEMGMNQPGEIRRLSEIARPDVGLVTTVRPAHLEGLGDITGVAREKCALFNALDPESGIAVVNLDDPLIRERARGVRCAKLGYTLDPSPTVADLPGMETVISCRSWSPEPEGASALFTIGGRTVPVRLSLLGRTSVQNALAAAAVGRAMGLTAYEIVRGIEEARPVPGRLAPIGLPGGIRIIDDTYNANPASVEAAIETLDMWAGDDPRIAILGDMLELGEDAPRYHREAGRAAARHGVTLLLAAGRHCGDIRAGAVGEGFPPEHARIFQNTDALVSWIKTGAMGIIPRNTFILIKGSRGMRLEKARDALIAFMKGGK